MEWFRTIDVSWTVEDDVYEYNLETKTAEKIHGCKWG